MKKEPSPLIFFDHTCSLCERTVHRLKKIDRDHRFLFKPLDELKGSLSALKRENTLVLVEGHNKVVWLRGRAVFRIFWLLGGRWRLLGWLCFLPVLPDLAYRLVARHRHLL